MGGGYIISTLKLFTELYRLLSLPAIHLRQFKTPVIHSHDSPALLSSIGVNGVVSEGFVRPSADERLYLFIISRCICSSLVGMFKLQPKVGRGGGEKSNKQAILKSHHTSLLTSN